MAYRREIGSVALPSVSAPVRLILKAVATKRKNKFIVSADLTTGLSNCEQQSCSAGKVVENQTGNEKLV